MLVKIQTTIVDFALLMFIDSEKKDITKIGCKVVYTLFMDTYNISLDLKRILEILELSISEFSERIGVSRVTLTNILNNRITCSGEILEKIYSFAYQKDAGLDLNRTKELLFKDDSINKRLLFHGAREEIIGNPDTKHSNPPNDFGNGFYVGDSLKQAAAWICKQKNGSVYCFYLENEDKLKIKKFTTDRDWLYVVLYYRSAFDNFIIDEHIKRLIDEVENSDLIIAPIIDNEMFKTIDSFSMNEITDEACMHAINATNLGVQYVFKSEKACQSLTFIERLYLCEKEKEYYLKEKDTLSQEGIKKSQLAKIEYRRKELYFDEIFKSKR